MENRIAKTLLGIFLLIAGTGIAAPSSEIREHYIFNNADNSRAFNVTIVESPAPNSATSVFYIESASGMRWRVERKVQYAAGRETVVFTDLRTRKSLVSTAHLPFGFSDFADAKAKRKAHPEPRKETRLSIDFGGKSLNFVEIELDVDQRRNEISKQVSAMVGDDVFMRELKSLSRLFSFPQFLGTCQSLDPLFSAGEQVCTAPTGYRFGNTLPKCDFDERFGIPCTEDQKNRIGSALKAGKTPRRY